MFSNYHVNGVARQPLSLFPLIIPNMSSQPCKYDLTLHRKLPNSEIDFKDVFWHRYEMRCKTCGKLFCMYNQRYDTYEYFDDIYKPDVDPESHSVMNTDPRMKSEKLRNEIESYNKNHHH